MKETKIKNGQEGYATLSCVLYGLFGILQILVWLGFDQLRSFYIDSNALGGIVMILIAIVFYNGASDLHRDNPEGKAYVFVATLLSLLFMGVSFLVLVANGLDASIAGEALSLGKDFIPMIYVGLVPLAGYVLWHEEFSISNFSRAGV